MLVEKFIKCIQNNGIDLYCGVPDSILKDFCFYLHDHILKGNHILAANEGNALAIASGYYLGTGNPSLVYMQNSGLGNVINPLLSLNDPQVYSIPALLLIGWRGEPGVHDEPQHLTQGKITLSLLDLAGIPYEVLNTEQSIMESQVNKAVNYMKDKQAPFALIVKKNYFDKYERSKRTESNYLLTREKAIKMIIDGLGKNDIIVATTGKTSRELFEYRIAKGDSEAKDFLVVGSMGHASQVALGLSLAKPNKQILCFDGDGAVIMHLGGMGTIGVKAKDNYKHIIFNNGTHESVGGQETIGFDIDFCEIAKACRYNKVYCVENEDDLNKIINEFLYIKGPALLEIKIKSGSRPDLGRPGNDLIELKKRFMRSING